MSELDNRSPPAARSRTTTATSPLLALYRAGDLDAAEAACKDALQANPRHHQALALLGLIRLDRGDNGEAVRLLDASLSIEPDQPAALNNRGNALNALGRHEEALASFQRAIELKSDFRIALTNRGNLLQALGRLDAALASFDQVITLRPDDGLAYYNRGNALLALRRHEDALASFERAVALGAGNANTYNNRGLTLQALGRREAALASFERAVALAPDDPRGHYNRGNALLELERYEEASASFAVAIALDPGHADAHNNWGTTLLKLDRHEAALACFDKAIALKPDHAAAYYNRGKPLTALKRYDEALACYDRAIALRPSHADAHWDKSLVLLLLGDFAQGWPLYEWRWRRRGFTSPRRNFAPPLWLGAEPLSGKTILLHAEQGLGDTIQFCRYAAEVSRRGARVVLEVQPALRTLMSSLDGADAVIATGDALPPFDCHTPLLSLPLAMKTRLESVPAPIPYLHATPRSTADWAARLGAAAGPRIGLAWTGSAGYKNDRNRSIGLADLLPLLDCGAAFIGLQKDVRPSDEAVLASDARIRNLGPSLTDFADTAGLIANLDLVISVDTAVAHLAGALGKPVWILLPYAPDWRWLLEREDSPWYPTARLLRQPSFGDWRGVIARAAEALKGLQG